MGATSESGSDGPGSVRIACVIASGNEYFAATLTRIRPDPGNPRSPGAATAASDQVTGPGGSNRPGMRAPSPRPMTMPVAGSTPAGGSSVAKDRISPALASGRP